MSKFLNEYKLCQVTKIPQIPASNIEEMLKTTSVYFSGYSAASGQIKKKTT